MNISQEFSVQYNYKIEFTRDLFNSNNQILLKILHSDDSKKVVKAAFVIDDGVARCHPKIVENITRYFENIPSTELSATPLIVKGGEQAKNSTLEFDRTLSMINEAKIDRHSYLIAIGGGAVLDMAGFAASVGHRGIRHIRIPTTVLSQNDSGVGVKNGINYFGKKNFIGAFNPPVAVINDIEFLATLDNRNWRSGIAEAVKVALVKDRVFFSWLENNKNEVNNRELEVMQKLIFDCALLHSQHISQSNDPFEMGSSRPLDFGHWSAHKLEQLTNFEVKHGEAVAIGIALDVIYSQLSGLLDFHSCERILQLLGDYGFNLFHPMLLANDIISINPLLVNGLEEFREHLGGELTITLIDQIGSQVDVHEMDKKVIEQAANILKDKQSVHAY